VNEDKWIFTPDKLMPIEKIISDTEECHYIDAYLGYEYDFQIDSILYYLKDYKQLQNNWNELKKKIEFSKGLQSIQLWWIYDSILEKMQELEQGKDE
jgi:hypothetical protein